MAGRCKKSLQVYKFTSLQVYTFTSLQVYKFTSLQVYMYIWSTLSVYLITFTISKRLSYIINLYTIISLVRPESTYNNQIWSTLSV